AAFGNVDASTDEVIPWLAAIAEDCHAEGTAVMIQLTHLGPRNSNFTADWLPLISAGRHREPTHRSFTKAMEDFDIERVVDDFAGGRRLPLRVIDAMRAEADGMALGVRMSVLEQVDDGLTEDLAVEALSEYAAHGIDFLNLNVGTISSDRELAEAIPGMGTPS